MQLRPCLGSKNRSMYDKLFSVRFITIHCWYIWKAVQRKILKNFVKNRAIFFSYPKEHIVGNE